eukprot:PhM_4_TR1251/c1_g1_i2/m.81151
MTSFPPSPVLWLRQFEPQLDDAAKERSAATATPHYLSVSPDERFVALGIGNKLQVYRSVLSSATNSDNNYDVKNPKNDCVYMLSDVASHVVDVAWFNSTTTMLPTNEKRAVTILAIRTSLCHVFAVVFDTETTSSSSTSTAPLRALCDGNNDLVVGWSECHSVTKQRLLSWSLFSAESNVWLMTDADAPNSVLQVTFELVVNGCENTISIRHDDDDAHRTIEIVDEPSARCVRNGILFFLTKAKRVELWELNSARKIAMIPILTTWGTVTSISVGPDAQRVLLYGNDGSAQHATEVHLPRLFDLDPRLLVLPDDRTSSLSKREIERLETQNWFDSLDIVPSQQQIKRCENPNGNGRNDVATNPNIAKLLEALQFDAQEYSSHGRHSVGSEEEDNADTVVQYWRLDYAQQKHSEMTKKMKSKQQSVTTTPEGQKQQQHEQRQRTTGFAKKKFDASMASATPAREADIVISRPADLFSEFKTGHTMVSWLTSSV